VDDPERDGEISIHSRGGGEKKGLMADSGESWRVRASYGYLLTLYNDLLIINPD